MDFSDVASDVENDQREAAIFRAMTLANAAGLVATRNGTCLNCEAENIGEKRWCDPECRDEFDGRRRRLGTH